MISISGHSDDVVCINGDVNDEIAAGRTITVGDATRGVKVIFKYAPGKNSGPVWRASVQQINEGVPMFPVSIVEAPTSVGSLTYSVQVNIDCPKDTSVMVGKRNLAQVKL